MLIWKPSFNKHEINLLKTLSIINPLKQKLAWRQVRQESAKSWNVWQISTIKLNFSLKICKCHVKLLIHLKNCALNFYNRKQCYQVKDFLQFQWFWSTNQSVHWNTVWEINNWTADNTIFTLSSTVLKFTKTLQDHTHKQSNK